MTNQSINIEDLLSRLTKESTHYFAEQKFISTISHINGRTLYSRYKKFNAPITTTLLQQHINKEITLAISIEKEEAIAFQYMGEHSYAFAILLLRIAQEFHLEEIFITSYDLHEIVLYIPKNSSHFEAFLQKSVTILEKQFPNQWLQLPQESRPEIGNILKLPREIITLER